MSVSKDWKAEELEAQMREADAKLDMLQAQAEIRAAREEMDEISGLRAGRDHARKMIDGLKQRGKQNIEKARADAEAAVHDLEAAIARVKDQYHAWDEARLRHLNARLDESEAELRLWKAQAEKTHAQQAIKRHDALAVLEERIATARARSAQAAHERYSRKSQEALEEAARHFDEAYDAAAKRYEGKQKN